MPRLWIQDEAKLVPAKEDEARLVPTKEDEAKLVPTKKDEAKLVPAKKVLPHQCRSGEAPIPLDIRADNR